MKIYRSEFTQNYQTYSFGYTEYAIRESESRAQTLALGYLPYTGLWPLPQNSYYLARSLRVKTSPFELSSENRRIFRKLEDEDIQYRFTDLDTIKFDNDLHDFCLEYAKERFSTEFTLDRLQHILNHSHANKLIQYTSGSQLRGLVILGADEKAWHYWFAFFDLEFLPHKPFGKWVMTKTLELAQNEGIEYVYLGTCYGKHSLYKVRDFNGISYFDGNLWSEDVKKLKMLCKNDQNIEDIDLIKEDQATYSYLKQQ